MSARLLAMAGLVCGRGVGTPSQRRWRSCQHPFLSRSELYIPEKGGKQIWWRYGIKMRRCVSGQVWAAPWRASADACLSFSALHLENQPFPFSRSVCAECWRCEAEVGVDICARGLMPERRRRRSHVRPSVRDRWRERRLGWSAGVKSSARPRGTTASLCPGKMADTKAPRLSRGPQTSRRRRPARNAGGANAPRRDGPRQEVRPQTTRKPSG